MAPTGHRCQPGCAHQASLHIGQHQGTSWQGAERDPGQEDPGASLSEEGRSYTAKGRMIMTTSKLERYGHGVTPLA